MAVTVYCSKAREKQMCVAPAIIRQHTTDSLLTQNCACLHRAQENMFFASPTYQNTTSTFTNIRSKFTAAFCNESHHLILYNGVVFQDKDLRWDAVSAGVLPFLQVQEEWEYSVRVCRWCCPKAPHLCSATWLWFCCWRRQIWQLFHLQSTCWRLSSGNAFLHPKSVIEMLHFVKAGGKLGRFQFIGHTNRISTSSLVPQDNVHCGTLSSMQSILISKPIKEHADPTKTLMSTVCTLESSNMSFWTSSELGAVIISSNN